MKINELKERINSATDYSEDSRKELLKEYAKERGNKYFLITLIEEMAELTQVLTKELRIDEFSDRTAETPSFENRELHLFEEISDVSNMLDCLIYSLEMSNIVDTKLIKPVMNVKLDRIKERLEEIKKDKE